MSTTDIRAANPEEVSAILFSDQTNDSDGCILRKRTFVSIETDCLREEGDSAVFIDSKEDAENLIKALEKAIELGWWK